ncbi:MAG TPA: diguanylate cyclase, partial [Xanthomonadales bacterium]|nr:diguanylate cyclase [Xanthomonadales bacterium]
MRVAVPRSPGVFHFLRGLMVAWLLSCAGVVFAQAPPLVVDASTPPTDLAPHLELLEDPARTLGIDEVRGAAAARFDRNDGKVRSLGFSRSAWWVRFTVRNPGAEPLRLVLRQDYPLIDHLDVWSITPDGSTRHVATGDLLPFDQRPIRHNEFLVPLDIAARSEQVVHVRFDTAGSLNIGLRLYAPDDLVADVAQQQLAWGAFYGSILLLALGNLLLFALVRDAAFLYYSIYLVTYGSYMAAYNGLTFQYLWPGEPQLASLSQLVLLPLALAFLLQFSRTILALADVWPRADRVALALMGLTLACIPLAPFVEYRTLILPLAILTLVIIVFLIVAAIASVRTGRIASRFYLSGLSIFLLGVFAYMLKTFGLLPHNALTQHGYQVGSLLEFLLLYVALGARVSELKRTGLTDNLTGLSNRRSFDEQLATEFEAARARGRELSLLVIDIDHFKRLNDTRGHAEGDRALRVLARILRSQARKPDAAYRYGGEEFVVRMPGARAESALALAERLRERVAAETAGDLAITISIGIAALGDRGAAVARYAAALSRTPVVVTEALRDALHAHFTPRELVVLATTIAQVNFWTRFNQGLGVPAAG